MAETTIKNCPICKKPLAGPTWGIGDGKVGHESCFKTHVQPKRTLRMGECLAMMRADTLANRHREMREAIANRDKYRREAGDILKSLEAQAEKIVFDKIRRLSLWKRLLFCFNPFGV